MTKPEIADDVLLRMFRDGSTRNKAFEAILDKYQQRVYWQIRRMVLDHDDADDVLQNTFIKIWENLERFKENSKLYTWIYRIATNESLQFLSRRKTVSIDDESLNLAENLQTGTYFNGNGVELKLQAAILQLPDKQRLVFNLKYYDNLTYDEMEEVTGTSTGALKASYHHAVKKIEGILKQDLNLTY